MTEARVLAVDGGNSKTDVALAGADGALLALVRGPTSSPHWLGADGALDLIGGLIADALSEAGIAADEAPVAAAARIQLAGADQPDEEAELQKGAEQRGWASSVSTGNDTFALLRAGSDRGWGVAVVCGAGINGLGVAPDGRCWRFAALGPISGDWGGGADIGLAALGAAARSGDGRGPVTVLERLVPEHFGLPSATAVASAIQRAELPYDRVAELVPVVFSAADGDAVAAGIVERLADEIFAFARAAIEGLAIGDEEFEVVLGGGVVRHCPARVRDDVSARIASIAPRARAVVADAPPVAGAALLALDDLGAPPEAKARLRRELVEADRRLVGAPA